MVDVKGIANPLFLREEELRQAIEMLFFAYRDFTGEPVAILAGLGLGRAHHRVIYFVGSNPGITVSELLRILARKRVVYGTGVFVRSEHCGSRIIKKQKT